MEDKYKLMIVIAFLFGIIIGMIFYNLLIVAEISAFERLFSSVNVTVTTQLNETHLIELMNQSITK